METVIAKVQKLLALAAGNKSVEEAAVAMARVQELLMKHKLSMADIELRGNGDDGEKVGQIFVDERTGLQLKWKSDLMFGLARAFFCEALRQRNAVMTRLIIIGKPSDTQTVAYVYEYLRREIEAITKKNAVGRGFAYANSFRVGAVAEIMEKLSAVRRQRKAAAAAAPTAAVTKKDADDATNALAIIDKAAADNESFIAAKYRSGDQKVKKIPAARASHYSAYYAGREAAAAIKLPGAQTKQLGAEAAKLKGAR